MEHIANAGPHIDAVISHMNPDRHILYFQSGNRRAIEKALQSSSLLPGLLRLSSDDLRHPEHELTLRLRTKGYCLNLSSPEAYKTAGGLGHLILKDTEVSKLRFVYLKDFQVFQREELRSMLLKAFLDAREEKGREGLYLLISSPQLMIPEGFSNEIELIREAVITPGDVARALREEIAREAERRNPGAAADSLYTPQELDYCARSLCCLEEEQIQSVFFKLRDRFCTELLEILPDCVREEKRKEEEKNPSLRFIDVVEDPCTAGLGKYMEWLDDRVEDFLNPSEALRRGTPAPKGALLCGVPGTGKTQMARQTAWRMGGGKMSLIRFDISRLQSKDYGASEAKMEHFLNRISANAPCVMMIDEIEKTFQDSEDKPMHEVKRQMLGQLLAWMQDRTANVFTFITANRIDALPAELLRDGRISGRFFAFLPTYRDLMSILWFKLEPLAKREIFDPRFCETIWSQCRQMRDAAPGGSPALTPLDGVFNRGVRGERDGEFTTRTPFMTGANMESLLEMTNRELRKQNRLSGCNMSLYAEQMLECFRSPDFIPQGQSNMEDIVNIWLRARKNQYQEVSAYTLLPFDSFHDGKFTDNLPAPQCDYDRHLQNTMKNKIEAAWQTRQDSRNALRKMAADT